MRPRAARFAALSGLLLFIALASSAAAAVTPVTIMGFAFMPASVMINAGDTVTWTNRDQAAHSAVFAGGGPQTPVLANGQSGSIPFPNPGTFDYVCGIHGASMSGSVIVRAVATPQPTAPPPTPAPTVRPTVAPTAAPTVAPTAEPTPTDSAAPTPTTSGTPSATVAPTAAATGAIATAIVAAPAPLQPSANDGANSSALVLGAAALAVLAIVAFAFTRIRR